MKETQNSIKCLKCGELYGKLSHLNKFGKQICNSCCKTRKIDEQGTYKGCECYEFKK